MFADSIVIGGYFFRCDTQYDTDQTAVGTIHMFIKHNHCHHHRLLRFLWYSVLSISFHINNTLLCYTLVSVLVLGTGIARGNIIGYWVPFLVSF